MSGIYGTTLLSVSVESLRTTLMMMQTKKRRTDAQGEVLPETPRETPPTVENSGE